MHTISRRNILLVGYYGFNNTGDEAILKSLLDQFRATQRNISITVVSGNPDYISAEYKVGSIYWRDIPAISAAIKMSDLIIIGGGGLLQDYWGYKQEQMLTPDHHSMSFYGGVPVLAALHGKPFVMYSLGIGPLLSSSAKELTYMIAKQASYVSVRDVGSKDLLKGLGVDIEKIQLVPDPAFSLTPAFDEADLIFAQYKITNPSAPVIGVCLRKWSIDIYEDKWQDAVARSLDKIASSLQAQILFIPFQSLQGEDILTDDVEASNEVINKMKFFKQAHVILTVYPPDVIAGLLARCDLVLGMRLHSLIFAFMSGVPAVGIAYDDKIVQLFRQFGMDDYLLSLKKFSSLSLTSLLQSAYANKNRIKENLMIQSQAMKKEGIYFSRKILNFLDSNQPVEIVPEFKKFIQELSLNKIDQVAQLKSHVEQLTNNSKQFDEIRSSSIWSGVELYLSLRRHFRYFLSMPGRVVKKERETLRKLDTHHFFSKLLQHILIFFANFRETIHPRFKNWEKDLDKILEEHRDSKGVVVILPSIGWDTALFQRPQQMSLAFARQGYLVLYLELSYTKRRGISNLSEHIYKVLVPARPHKEKFATPMPFDALKRLDRPLTIAYPYNKLFLDHLKEPRVIYEYIDELDVFAYDIEFLEDNHNEFLSKADVVVATAKRLYDEVLIKRDDAFLCPNGVDYDHFQLAGEKQTSYPPKDIEQFLSFGHPTIGYYGALANWFDYELLEEVAHQRPNWNFILIGVNHDNSIYSSSLLKSKNVHWIGPRHYSILPLYLNFFEVAIIPFKVNDITHSTSPLKLFEYMAGHKPVVATAMHEVQRYNDVLIAHNAQEFVEKIEEALALRNDLEFIARLDKMARENTWDSRVEQILNFIENKS